MSCILKLKIVFYCIQFVIQVIQANSFVVKKKKITSLDFKLYSSCLHCDAVASIIVRKKPTHILFSHFLKKVIDASIVLH